LGQRNRNGQIPVAMMDITSVGRILHGLVHRRFTGGKVYVVTWVLLRISRLDTISPAGPDRQVEPGQHSPARG
jgi:hypothetical protein